MNMSQKQIETPASQAEFVALLTEAHSKLLGYLMSLLGQQNDAEDVLQQASVIMWEKFNTFEPGTDFFRWASRIAFYEARNFQRMASRSRLHFDDDLLATLSEERLEDLSLKSTRVSALESCLQKLSEANCKLVKATYCDRSSIVQLAGQLKVAPQTLYNRLNLIRRALADCVERQLHRSGA